MGLSASARMCASGRSSSFLVQNYLIQRRTPRRIRQHRTAANFTTKVTGNRAAKSLTRRGAVSRQRNRPSPQPRSQRNVACEFTGAKRSIRGDEALHPRWHAEIGSVGDRLHSCEFDSPRLRALRNSSGFHVDRAGVITLGQPTLLIFAGYGRRAHQNSLAGFDLYSRAVGGVDHCARPQNISNLQGRIKSAGKADRDDQRWPSFLNNRLGRAPRRFCSNAAANQSCTSMLKNIFK